MEGVFSKYAVISRPTKLHLHQSADVPQDNVGGSELSVDRGTLIKVFQTETPANHPNGKDGSNGGKLSTVQVLDLVHHEAIYENLYECPQSSLHKVSEELWPYVISIADPERRLHLLHDQNLCRLVVYFKTNSFVSVAGELFGRGNARFDCIVRYIGPVLELHPVGYFFGLELLHLDNGYSPQSESIPFAPKYMQCDPSLAIITTADWISPIPNEVHKKFSTRELISETFEKVRSVIGPSSCSASTNSSTASLRRKKKQKNKEPTAQFYDIISDPEVVPDSAEMERKSKQTVKGTDSKVESSNTKLVNSAGSVENHEQTSERQSAKTGTRTSAAHNTGSSSTGILKHRRIISVGSGSNGVSATLASNTDKDSSTTKPVSFMSLEDRDIVVIDKADINESTRHESDIIVLDKARQEVDLAELLGDNWPKTAGEAASMLNKTQKQRTEQQQVGGVSLSTTTSTSTNTETSNTINASNSNTKKNEGTCTSATEKGDISKSNHSIGETRSPPPVVEAEFMQSSPLQEVPDSELGVGSMVEVTVSEASEHLYGVIRWIGVPPGVKHIMVGVELEDEHNDKQLFITDGSFDGVSLFKCPEGRGLFVRPEQCAIDRRFLEVDHVDSAAVGYCDDNDGKAQTDITQSEAKMFGQVECPPISGAIAPLRPLDLKELEELCGKFKGIQGHHNSCYLDVTLFSMFTFTSVFDSLLFRAPEPEDIPHYAEVQKVLREEIVNPLRKNVFVRADRVMKLRQFLDKLSSVSGLTSEEKDPEEFLNSLLAQIMRVEPFLKLSSGQDAFFYQLFVEKDERLSFPSVQQLFEQSFYTSDIKLKEVPSCLIIQMPRFGKNYKMYPRILPSQVLDVTDIIDDSPRQCSVCGKLAQYECRDCFGILQSGMGLESTAFCPQCLDTVHRHAKRANHSSRKLLVPQDFRVMAERMAVPRLYMELFAVVCIETSHYVTFVKAGSGPDAPWCFFDSMADRKGEQNGYNIPEMLSVPDLPQWLSEEGARTVNETSANDKMLPEHARRLFCDAYMCMYQSTDVMMYR